MLSVLLRYTDSDYVFGIFKLFLYPSMQSVHIAGGKVYNVFRVLLAYNDKTVLYPSMQSVHIAGGKVYKVFRAVLVYNDTTVNVNLYNYVYIATKGVSAYRSFLHSIAI